MEHPTGNTILVVDDTQDQSELLRCLLEKAGFNVLTACNGHEGREVALRERPDLIISDVRMPVAGGVEMCRWIRAEPDLCTVPILLVSALSNDSADAVEGLRAGADDYLEAPYEPMRFIAKVVRLIERKQTEEALKRSADQLRQAQKMEAVGMLAGGIAHDFNNLLTAITGYCDLSLRHLPPHGQLYRNIQEIKKAGARATSLTRQLLAFSRKLVLQPKVVDLNAIVVDMQEMLQRLIGEDIELLTNLEPALGHVKADQGQFEQVIMNLVVNAKDAMPSGGQLVIETANVEMDEEIARRYASVQSGPHVLLSVRDTGSGMDAKTQERIFEPFFTTKKAGQGTGLGLATVYGVIKQSGGYISVESAIGQGTTFRIYLPRVAERAETIKPGHILNELPRGTETILLVEDEQIVRDMTRAILEMSGYTVLEARHGEEALRLCEQHSKPIDLLVADVVMPQMSGPQIARTLALSYPHMRVLYMSGYAEKALAHRSGFNEGSAFIEKPFTPEALGRKVREVLNAALVEI